MTSSAAARAQKQDRQRPLFLPSMGDGKRGLPAGRGGYSSAPNSRPFTSSTSIFDGVGHVATVDDVDVDDASTVGAGTVGAGEWNGGPGGKVMTPLEAYFAGQQASVQYPGSAVRSYNNVAEVLRLEQYDHAHGTNRGEQMLKVS